MRLGRESLEVEGGVLGRSFWVAASDVRNELRTLSDCMVFGQ